MDKLKMHSPSLIDENILQIRKLFPGCVTEAEDENGELILSVNFDQLKQEFSDHIVEGPQERYRLDWPGKREALLTANAPIAKTLRPDREESVDFDTTQNLFIEGDNLDALKLLQETYLGKVKMIYIDPPYNTGKDFIYEDNFAENSDEFLRRSNQKDEEGNRLVANTEAKGRFHSNWLNMIYPRIRLAKNLLADDGVLIISIDENELINLQRICEEVFGRVNVIGNLPVIMNLKGNQDAYGFAETHEYVVVCVKSKDACELNHFPVDEEAILKEWTEDEFGLYKEADNLRATGVNAPREKRPNLWYPIFLDEETKDFYITGDNLPKSEAHTTILPINPEGIELSWYWSKRKFSESNHNLILKHTSNGWQFYKKQRPALGDLPTKKPKSFFYKAEYSTSTATTHLKKLFGKKIFDGPKPVPFVLDLITIAANKDAIIMDFYAGSATTAHAMLLLNSKDGGNRKFILVQLPEEINEKSEAFKAGYSSIAEISKERIRRAGKKILDGECHENWNKDVGFRVLKVDTSNMADVYYSPDAIEQKDLLSVVDNIKPGRDNPEDLLFQVLLDWGVDLSLPIRRETIQGKTVLFVDENALIACFDTGITEDLVKELADYQPLRAVFRDNGFVSDAAKINVDQIFKQMSPGTEVKSI